MADVDTKVTKSTLSITIWDAASDYDINCLLYLETGTDRFQLSGSEVVYIRGS